MANEKWEMENPGGPALPFLQSNSLFIRRSSCLKSTELLEKMTSSFPQGLLNPACVPCKLNNTPIV